MDAGYSFELWLSFDRVICRLDVVETVSIDKSLFFRHLTFFATGGVGVSLLLPTTRPALGHGWVVVAQGPLEVLVDGTLSSPIVVCDDNWIIGGIVPTMTARRRLPSML